jgi:hypothetical protein
MYVGQMVVYAEDSPRYRVGDTRVPIGRVVRVNFGGQGNDFVLVRWNPSRLPSSGESWESTAHLEVVENVS